MKSAKEQASIEITERTIGIWFIKLPNNTGDWMGHLCYLPDDKIELVYRFRYYDPADPNNEAFSGKDHKSWYRGTISTGKEKAIKAMRALVKEMERGSGEKGDELLMHFGNVEVFFASLRLRPWVHMKTL